MHVRITSLAILLACSFSVRADVKVEQTPEGAVFVVDGVPAKVKGVTFSYKLKPDNVDYLMSLVTNLGANAVRTWGTGPESLTLLDGAQKYGVKVMLGLWLAHGRDGREGEGSHNYADDANGNKAQFSDQMQWVEKYKDHPALLCWGIGNEVILNIASEEEKTAYAGYLETVCRAVKQVDPSHPLVSVSAWTTAVPYWEKYTPSLDVYGINAYGPAVGAIEGTLKDMGVEKPFLVTEFGPMAEWDCPVDENGVRIEPSDPQKYEQIADGWKKWIEPAKNAIGGFVFNLGDDWNHTSVWLDMFMRGKKRPAYWATREAFTGRKPDNGHPYVFHFNLSTRQIRPGAWVDVSLKVKDVEKDPLEVAFYYSERDGSREESNKLRLLGFEDLGETAYRFRAPGNEGVFKIYAFIIDNRENLTVASTSLRTVGEPEAAPSAADQGPVKVEVRGDAQNGYKLLRGGKPMLINGAGGERYLEQLKEYGGNSIRTWGHDALEKLVDGKRLIDRAHELGIGVTAGIWLGHQRHGFDYTDESMLKKQRAMVKEAVEKYKDHPALLLWGIGNEMEGPTRPGTDPDVWKEINHLAGMIKRIDPNHPVMTVVAGVSPAKIESIKKYYPEIDILGVNAYAPAGGVGNVLEAAGWTKPYVLTEYGLPGPWEVAHTEWGAPIEPSSKAKAAMYYVTHGDNLSHGKICLGSYVFLWGDKQEATASWFGMFLPDGSKLPTVDAMCRAWSGKWPGNRSPVLQSFESEVNLKRVDGGKTYTAKAVYRDPEGDPLCYHWEVFEESRDRRSGGEEETRPELVENAILESGPDGSVTFNVPARSGGYRLFVTVKDGKGSAAIDNLPFFVK
ncbi:MAG: hypothetical protein KJ626_01890 [Verrucomicrobia bacterium]|nr:hypothetical protein [Verrucomicrobiota bacterium]